MFCPNNRFLISKPWGLLPPNLKDKEEKRGGGKELVVVAKVVTAVLRVVCFCLLEFKHKTKHMMIVCKVNWISWTLKRIYIYIHIAERVVVIFHGIFSWSGGNRTVCPKIIFPTWTHNVLVTMLMDDEGPCSTATKVSLISAQKHDREILVIFL